MTAWRGVRIQHYTVAAAAVAVALAIEQLTWPWLRATPLLVFNLAVIVSAAFGGLGPGLLATLLSTIIGQRYIASGGPPVVAGTLQRTLSFDFLAVVISLAFGLLRAARGRAAQAREAAERAAAAKVRFAAIV